MPKHPSGETNTPSEKEIFAASCREMVADQMQFVWSTGSDGQIDYLNREWYAFTGLPPGTVGNDCWTEILHPADLPGFTAAWNAAFAAGTMLEAEVRAFRASDRAARWFLVRARPVRDVTGQIVRWYGVSTDITAHKETQQAYQATAERLRLALDAGGLGLWDWNIVTDEINGSSEYNAMFDLPPNELRGNFERAMERIHPDDRESATRSLQDAMAQHRDPQVEVRSIHRDGSIHWILAQGRAVYDESGKAVRMIGVVQEITQRKAAEEAVR